MNGNIELHPEKGVNPRITVCCQCGEDIGLVLLGRHEHKDICNKCGLVYYGGKPLGGECPRCHTYGWHREPIEEHEKIPEGLCEKCQESQRELDKVVAEGGIYWRCDDCNATGAIRASSPLAKQVREQLGIEAPKPCGVQFSKAKGCPVCNKKEG